jgi:hypothetical protein
MGDDFMVPRNESKLEKAFGAKKVKAPDKPKQKTAEEHLKEWSKDQTKAIGGKGFLVG